MRTAVLNLCRGLPEKSFNAGDALMTEGGTDKLLYVLIDGAVDIFKGDTHVNQQSEAGGIYGEMSVLLNVPHTATVKAAVPTKTYVIENADEFLRLHPEMSYQLAAILARKLNSITTYLADIKHQFEDHDDHLGMVDEVLESLLHEQVEEIEVGSARYPDDTID